MRVVWRSAAALACWVGGGAAWASDAGEHFLEAFGPEPAQVMFVVDQSAAMAGTCGRRSCLEWVQEAVADAVLHLPWLRASVYGTAHATDDNTAQSVAPIGSTATEVADALEALPQGTTVVRNLAEVLADLATDELASGSASTGTAPICFECGQTHVVTLAAGRPRKDWSPAVYATLPSWLDVRCTDAGYYTYSSDSGCQYDDMVNYLYWTDRRPDVPGTQNVVVHTIGIDLEPGGIADTLYANASWLTGHEGVYLGAGSGEDIRAAIALVIEQIRPSRTGTGSALVHSSGDDLLLAWSEYGVGEPLARGHLRAYALGQDVEAGDVGQLVLDGDPDLDGARWDAGDALEVRPVYSREYNEDDRDGAGGRDLYTFLPELTDPSLLSLATEGLDDGRMGFDRELVESLAASASILDLLLPVGSAEGQEAWDLDWDGQVDDQDLQVMVDFVRGVPSTWYPLLPLQRGTWRLGDTPLAEPVVARASRGQVFTTDPTYRSFLDQSATMGWPDLVLLPSNAGMLHAFDLDDGEELWAWVPGSLLLREPVADWSSRLVDVLLYGTTPLLEGAVAVDDVWVDDDGDGERDCVTVPGDCEWRRVVTVSQGRGGPAVLALDITDPTAPRFLWEHANPSDSTAAAETLGGPVLAPVATGTTEVTWAAFWASGRSVSGAWGAEARQLGEPALHLRAVGDDWDTWQTSTLEDLWDQGQWSPEGWNHHPVADLGGSADPDLDSRYEEGQTVGRPTLVDTDYDGVAEVAYLVVTASGADAAGGHLYKVLLDAAGPTWCHLYDAATESGSSPESAYAITAAWFEDGTLGLYWGTGTPYDPVRGDRGQVYALRDPTPGECQPVAPICGSDGAWDLEESERLTDDPLVYDGVLYLSTWEPDDAGCGEGTGRLRGLAYDTCEEVGVGSTDGNPSPVEVSGPIHSFDISDYGSLFFSTTAVPLTGQVTDRLHMPSGGLDPVHGTYTMSLREVVGG